MKLLWMTLQRSKVRLYMEGNEHHIWCNFFMRPREGCKLCESLYVSCPIEGLTPDEMFEKYYPDVTIRAINMRGENKNGW